MRFASWRPETRWLVLAGLPRGDPRLEGFEGRTILPWVSRMAAVTTAGLYFVRFLLSAMDAALPTRPAASTQNGEVTWTSMSTSAFWTPGLEIRTSTPAPFSGSMAGWSDFDVCT